MSRKSFGLDAFGPIWAAVTAGLQEEAERPPSGPGWVFQLSGYHYNNHRNMEEGPVYVQKSLLWNLSQPDIEAQRGEKMVHYPVGKLGIKSPLLLGPIKKIEDEQLADPRAANEEERKMIDLRRYDFTVQFCWQEPPPEDIEAAMAEAGIVPPAEEAAGASRASEATGGGE